MSMIQDSPLSEGGSSYLLPTLSLRNKQTMITKSPMKPLITLKLKLLIVCRDLTYKVPYCEANACPVACWKKLSPTTIAVRLRLAFEKSSLKCPCSGSSSSPFCSDKNSSSISSEVKAPSRNICRLVRASSVRPLIRSHRGDWIYLAACRDGYISKASYLWNKPNEGYNDAGYNEEKPQWDSPGAVIIDLTGAIANPAYDHSSKLDCP